jgi:hypothetical protein
MGPSNVTAGRPSWNVTLPAGAVVIGQPVG